jgi:deoxyribonuclease-4
VREFAESVMTDDLRRLEATPGALYNFHPGSHVGQGIEKGIELISGMLGRIIASFGGNIATTILLETMAGKGSEVGGTFEELREIMDRTEHPLGVCLDTCHIWDGGYDIVGDLDGVLEKFDRAVGIDKLKAIHINDSLNDLGARKDRHAKIGKGKIGLDAFAAIVNHPQLKDLPFYLETPCDLQGYKEEIALLKGLVK